VYVHSPQFLVSPRPKSQILAFLHKEKETDRVGCYKLYGTAVPSWDPEKERERRNVEAMSGPLN